MQSSAKIKKMYKLENIYNAEHAKISECIQFILNL